MKPLWFSLEAWLFDRYRGFCLVNRGIFEGDKVEHYLAIERRLICFYDLSDLLEDR